MNKRNPDTLIGEVIDESAEITCSELCEVCSVERALIDELVNEGVLDPVGRQSGELCFKYVSVHRTRIVRRLQNDLGVNLAGAALALELLDRIELLRRQLSRPVSR